MLFPEGRISEVQRRFMTTTRDANVARGRWTATFDDCQALVKALFADAAFRDEVDLSGVNSINWARVAAQSVYYVTAAVALGAPERAGRLRRAHRQLRRRLRRLRRAPHGAADARIVVATNGNDILARALETGRYAAGESLATQSPAMDIQVASNFERLYFEASRRDARGDRARLRGLRRDGAIDLPPPALAYMRDGFTGQAAAEDETAAPSCRP